MNTAEPLMWTKDGNVPESSLRYEHEWMNNPKEVILHERWFSKETGELMRNNCHMLAKESIPAIGGEQAVMP
jgi:hypothetical protein